MFKLQDIRSVKSLNTTATKVWYKKQTTSRTATDENNLSEYLTRGYVLFSTGIVLGQHHETPKLQNSNSYIVGAATRGWGLWQFFNNTYQVSSSYVQSFRNYCVDKQTNNEILLKTSTPLCCAMPVEKHKKTTQQQDTQNTAIPTASRLLLNGSQAKSVTTDPFSTAGTPVSGSRPAWSVYSKHGI